MSKHIVIKYRVPFLDYLNDVSYADAREYSYNLVFESFDDLRIELQYFIEHMRGFVHIPRVVSVDLNEDL